MENTLFQMKIFFGKIKVNTYSLLSGIIITSLSACVGLRQGQLYPMKKLPVPPGTICIAPNVFFDQFELTNIGYREYLAWIKGAYGENSEEYKSQIPDKNVWRNLHPAYAFLDTIYLTYFEFDYHPAVGISFEQATKYSKWRSDRVMEVLLYHNNIIQFDPSRPKDTIFTIEKYFSGNFMGIKPDPRFPYYPEYVLPDSNHYRKALLFADSVRAKTSKRRFSSGCCKELIQNVHCLNNILNKTSEIPFGEIPTTLTECHQQCEGNFIHRLEDNVRELTADRNVKFGRCFLNTCQTLVYLIRIDTKDVNAYTGFRNVCSYKIWKFEN